MKGSKFNLMAVIAIVVLLIYSYIVLMGLVYWRSGDIMLSGILTVVVVALVGLSVLTMSAAKATRWKGIGLTGQIVFGAIALVTLLLSSMPFAHFFNMVEKQDEIKSAFSQTLEYATGIDDAYKKYATEREEKYAGELRTAVAGRASDPAGYTQKLAAGGTTDSEKIENLTRRLHMKLFPAGMDSTLQQRKKWLQDASEMSVWNIALPANLNDLDATVKDWEENYRTMSEVKTQGVEYPTFSYDAYNSKTAELRQLFTKMSRPTVWSILAALFCFAVMLMPYRMTSTSVISKEDGTIAI